MWKMIKKKIHRGDYVDWIEGKGVTENNWKTIDQDYTDNTHPNGGFKTEKQEPS